MSTWMLGTSSDCP
ncbi:hypothetical protein HU200_065119 [Digitaria exilis]|uniref:Uncharacterized protein n=1 Tax=Digitaria exilis TaxID=1010633 RepID=A0A834ZZ55_9POAL|nr:hypothetical protein HU200_065119 [Digitaria exilis]